MKKIYYLACVLGISVVCAGFSFAQDDEARQQSGLPTFIGNRPGTRTAPGADASLSGTVTIQGLIDGTKLPSLSISVLANGTVVARQRVENRGGFSFDGIPKLGITLVVEADGLEIASLPLGTLNPPPLPNKQDVFVTWTQISQRIERRNEAIRIRNSYERSEANQKLFEKAMIGAGDKKNDSSLKLFKQLTETDAADYVAWTELGNAYFIRDKFSESEEAYSKALALKADFGPTLLNLGKLYLVQKQFDKSIDTLTKALAAAPSSADVNHYLGEAYLQSKKGSKAVIYLNEAIRLEPVEKAEIHLRLAALYNAAGAKPLASKEYKMFLDKVPSYKDKAALEKYISENPPK
jgi:tetratricopeptide (TPR) repeat protein